MAYKHSVLLNGVSSVLNPLANIKTWTGLKFSVINILNIENFKRINLRGRLVGKEIAGGFQIANLGSKEGHEKEAGGTRHK